MRSGRGRRSSGAVTDKSFNSRVFRNGYFLSYSNPSSSSPMHPISLPQAQTPPISTKPLPFYKSTRLLIRLSQPPRRAEPLWCWTSLGWTSCGLCRGCPLLRVAALLVPYANGRSVLNEVSTSIHFSSLRGNTSQW